MARLAAREEPLIDEMPSQDTGFWNAVRALPRRQAQVVALFYVDDVPVTEIAEVLGITAAPGLMRAGCRYGDRGVEPTTQEDP